MAELTVENLQEIRTRIEKLGLPDSFFEAAKQEAEKAIQAHFYVGRTIMLDQEPVKIFLGFQEYRPWRFVQDLLGLSLRPGRDNVLDRNTFFLLPDNPFSVREAYNMMKGRAVHRHSRLFGDEDYWMKLNTKKLYSGAAMPEMVNSNLNIRRWMEKSPLEPLLNPVQKVMIAWDLQGGNRVDLGGYLGKHARGMYLQTDPERNQVEVRDENRKVLDIREVIGQQLPGQSHQRRI
ncbi:MAG TPA: hypothetical protein VGN00_29940 [Puia sp.]|jgi:hypothetical protein